MNFTKYLPLILVKSRNFYRCLNFNDIGAYNKNVKKNRIFTAILIVILMGLLIAKPEIYMLSVYNGLILFGVSVLPAMFPFFFFTKILTSLDIASSFSKYSKRLMKKAFNAPPISGYILILSLLSGYPIGAKLVSDCYVSHIINEKEAKSVLSFCQTSGPLFILGTIGVSLLKNYTFGIIILVSHYLGALVNGIVLKTKKTSTESGKSELKTTANYDNILSDAIQNSIISVMIVGGYIAIFNMVVDVFYNLNIIYFISDLMYEIKIPRLLSEGVFVGLIEITRGVLTLSKGAFNGKILLPIITAMISFGGLSITIQSLTFLSKCKIKATQYFIIKISQATISFFIACIICSIVL